MKHTFKTIIKNIILEQTDSEEYVEISASDFENLAKIASYNLNLVSKMKRFGGKKIRVIGTLDFGGAASLTSLGNLAEVQGNLILSRTNVSDLSKLEKVSGTLDVSHSKVKKHDNVRSKYTNDYESSGYRIRMRLLRLQKLNAGDERRKNREWDLTLNPESKIALCANALYKYLVEKGDLEVMTDEDKEELQSEKERKEKLQAQYEENNDEEIANEIEEIENRISELESETADLYNIIPERYSFYGLLRFEVLTEDSYVGIYAVGDGDDYDEAIKEYWEQFISENGYEGFRTALLEDFLDKDRIYSDAFYEYDDDVRNNQDSYFDESSRQLSRVQLEEITKLEKEKDELEEKLYSEDMSDDSEEYDEIQDRISEIETEIDEIRDSPEGEVNENDIEEKVEELAGEARDNPLYYVNERRYDIKDYVDEEELIDYLVRSDGYDPMNYNDGSYHSVYVGKEEFLIMKIE